MRKATEGERPGHPIQVVARRTGLSADVIRVWERRHGAVSPSRSSTNRRLYSEEDLERLMLLRRATLAGRSIGQVAQLDADELASLVRADEAALKQVPGPRRSFAGVAPGRPPTDYLDALRNLDAARLKSALRTAAVDLGTPALIEQILVPLMTAVGEEWHRGALGIRHEHLAASLVRSLLEEIRESRSPTLGGPDIVIATPQGERHEIGALMVAAIAAVEGFDVTYLGSDLPLEETAATAAARDAAVLALSIVQGGRDAGLEQELRKLRRDLPVSTVIMAGGPAAANYETTLRDIDAILVPDLASFRAELKRIRADRA